MLPGAEDLTVKFKQFSGYLSVPGGTGALTKHLHYWYVESMSNPATDPVSFWTNGGPGCSGLLGGFTEQGPFRPTADGKLKLNDYAWNQRSNMIFFEAPAGVGFSYSDDTNDYRTGDDQTATDNYLMIQAFFARFPDLLKNDLYITSESYGGHYLPTLAKKIVDENALGSTPILNFKGFAVGNPFTDVYSGVPSGFATYWGHQLIAKPTWDRFQQECVGQKLQINLPTCELLFLDIYAEIGRNLNPYALDYPLCVDPVASTGRAQRTKMIRHMLKGLGIKNEKIYESIGITSENDYNPCTEDYLIPYLNRADVKAALHVKNDITWEECASFSDFHYSETDSAKSMTSYYQYLIKHKSKFNLKILVYSGDDDSVCSTQGTQQWIWDLGYNISGHMWSPYQVNNQTAGYITQWKDTNMAFATVHGAGHEVPAYTPSIALYLYNAFLDGDLTANA